MELINLLHLMYKKNTYSDAKKVVRISIYFFLYLQKQKVRFHYVDSGDESRPLILFLHGFPEFWYSWRHQIVEFSKDYRFVSVTL